MNFVEDLFGQRFDSLYVKGYYYGDKYKRT